MPCALSRQATRLGRLSGASLQVSVTDCAWARVGRIWRGSWFSFNRLCGEWNKHSFHEIPAGVCSHAPTTCFLLLLLYAHACSLANTNATFLLFCLARSPPQRGHSTSSADDSEVSSRSQRAGAAQLDNPREQRHSHVAVARQPRQLAVARALQHTREEGNSVHTGQREALSGLRRQTRTPRAAARPGRQTGTACMKGGGVRWGSGRRREALASQNLQDSKQERACKN